MTYLAALDKLRSILEDTTALNKKEDRKLARAVTLIIDLETTILRDMEAP